MCWISSFTTSCGISMSRFFRVWLTSISSDFIVLFICERRDSNPHGSPHWILSPARLPIPPLSRGHLIDCAGGLAGCQQSARLGDLGAGGNRVAHGGGNHGTVAIFGRKSAGPLKEMRPQ